MRDGEKSSTRPREQRAAARGRHRGSAGGPKARRARESRDTPFSYLIHRKKGRNGPPHGLLLLAELEAGHDKMARRDLARWVQRRILTLRRLKRTSKVFIQGWRLKYVTVKRTASDRATRGRTAPTEAPGAARLQLPFSTALESFDEPHCVVNR